MHAVMTHHHNARCADCRLLFALARCVCTCEAGAGAARLDLWRRVHDRRDHHPRRRLDRGVSGGGCGGRGPSGGDGGRGPLLLVRARRSPQCCDVMGPLLRGLLLPGLLLLLLLREELLPRILRGGLVGGGGLWLL